MSSRSNNVVACPADDERMREWDKLWQKTLSNVSGVSYSKPPWSRKPQLLESSRSSFARNSTSGWSSSTDMANDYVTQLELPRSAASVNPYDPLDEGWKRIGLDGTRTSEMTMTTTTTLDDVGGSRRHSGEPDVTGSHAILQSDSL